MDLDFIALSCTGAKSIPAWTFLLCFEYVIQQADWGHIQALLVKRGTSKGTSSGHGGQPGCLVGRGWMGPCPVELVCADLT